MKCWGSGVFDRGKDMHKKYKRIAVLILILIIMLSASGEVADAFGKSNANITEDTVCLYGTKWIYTCGQYKKKNPTCYTKKGMKIIKKFEGFYPNRYIGLDSDNYTIGYGHVIDNENIKEPISKKQATEFLKKDLKAPKQATKKYINNDLKIHIRGYQFDSLVSLGFNVGEGYLKEETSPALTELLRRGIWEEKDLVKEFGTYCGYLDNGVRKHSRGLWRRHVNEALLFFTGVYKNYSIKKLAKMGYKYPY